MILVLSLSFIAEKVSPKISGILSGLPVGSAIANIGTMIPEIMNHGVEHTTVTGTNLDLRTDFSLTKALAHLTVEESEHFTIIAGLTKGTIR